jgi:acyl-CoA dehydrogenase
VAVAPSAASSIEALQNVAGEPRCTVAFEGAPVVSSPAPAGVDPQALRERGALSRVMLIAGALQAISDLANAYSAERHQFGQAIGSFQAVQALLAMAAELAAAAATAGPARFEIAASKALAGDAVRAATRAVHQVHGAIGVTREYSLHHLSRRLWAWRAEYGDAEWPSVVGRLAVAAGPDRLYSLIQRGSASLT